MNNTLCGKNNECTMKHSQSSTKCSKCEYHLPIDDFYLIKKKLVKETQNVNHVLMKRLYAQLVVKLLITQI